MNLISIGEVLWDVVGETDHLGGAPLNFAAHAAKLGHSCFLVSAVGSDERGERCLSEIQRLGLTTEYIHRVSDYATGIVNVTLHDDGQPCFTIHRPAAYDFAELTDEQLRQLAQTAPAWIYFGTLAQTNSIVRSTTSRIIETIPIAKRFYDVNLRSGCFNREVVSHLLSLATVTKLNDVEIGILESLLGHPRQKNIEGFCREFALRFDLEAVCVTRGDKGCALLLGTDYVEAAAYRVQVADAIGAGDAFAAGLAHALSVGWNAKRSADFANRLGALAASRAGAIPDWSLQELEDFQQ